MGDTRRNRQAHLRGSGRLDALSPEIDVLAASVTVDSRDRVYCFNRSKEHPVVVFDREGNFLTSWGAGAFAFPHMIRANKDDQLWLVDRDHGQMMLFTTEGKLLRTIGTKGYRSDTGIAANDFRSDAIRDVTHGGGPFNLPTDIDVAPSGEMFVTDGYGNARVHKFAPDGTHIFLGRARHGAESVQFAACRLDHPRRPLAGRRSRERPHPGLRSERQAAARSGRSSSSVPRSFTSTPTTSFTSASTTPACSACSRSKANGSRSGATRLSVVPRHLGAIRTVTLCRARGPVGAPAAHREARARSMMVATGHERKGGYGGKPWVALCWYTEPRLGRLRPEESRRGRLRRFF